VKKQHQKSVKKPFKKIHLWKKLIFATYFSLLKSLLMSKIGLFLSSLFLSFAILGQNPGGRGMGGNNKTGHVFGKIVDEKGQGIPMVNILLLQNRMDTITKKKKDFVLKSTTTENNGEFSIEDVKITQGLKIKVAFYGFETIV
jgi:hypothetical protein